MRHQGWSVARKLGEGKGRREGGRNPSVPWYI